jgi:hypothetical protein
MVHEGERHIDLEQRVTKLEEELKNLIFSEERIEFEQEMLTARRRLAVGIMHSLINLPILFVDTQRRMSPKPDVFERGGRCLQILRELAAKVIPLINGSDDPESLFKDVEERTNQILEEHEFPWTRRLG